MDDGDSKILTLVERKQSSDSLDAGDILPPFWVRRSIRFNYEVDGFLLDYGFRFLPIVGCIFWILFLLAK